MDPISKRILLGSAVAGEALPTVIGEEALGGYFAGYLADQADGVADYGLIVAPASTVVTRAWKTSGSLTTHTNSPWDGATNTSDINNSSHPAAQYCAGLTTGGYSDWYLPSFAELEIAYYNFKPTTTANYTGSSLTSGPRGFDGNWYTSPSRFDYYFQTPGDPAQTSITAFQSGNAQAFNAAVHWTSNQHTAYTSASASDATGIDFSDGRLNPYRTKTFANYVRAFRRFAV